MANDTNSRRTSSLSPDRAITNRKEDLLGRSFFAKALAKAILGATDRESLVLALYGPYGSGKSSLKNMLLEELNAATPKLQILDFNPWQRPIRSHLSIDFFDELGIALGRGHLASKKTQRAALNAVRRWSSRLQGVTILLKLFQKVITIILLIGAASLFAARFFPFSHLISVMSYTFLLLGLVSLLSLFVDALSRFYEAGVDKGIKSLDETKQEVTSALNDLTQPILVILDDVDRLTPAELLELFQLVKANGDFPNLIYLLLADRSIVEEAVQKVLNVSGREYLEKIVQVAFDIPLVSNQRVHQVLFNGLDSLLEKGHRSRLFLPQRWNSAFSAISPYMRSLRDVKRFLSTLAFHMDLLTNEGELEVNPVDLISLEALRLFEPNVYEIVSSSKDLLTSVELSDATASATRSQFILDATSRSVVKQQKQALELLRSIFPILEESQFGETSSQESLSKRRRELRACSDENFHRYFRFALSEGDLPRGTIRELVATFGTRTELTARLNLLKLNGFENQLIQVLEDNSSEVTPQSAESFIGGVIDAGDVFPQQAEEFFGTPPIWRLANVCINILKRVDDLEKRISIIENVLLSTPALHCAISVVGLIRSDKAISQGGIFPKEHLDRLGRLGAQRIRSAASSGVLNLESRIFDLLRVWKEWGEPEGAKDFAKSLIGEEQGLLKFLQSAIREASFHSNGRLRRRRYIRSAEIEDLVGLEYLKDKVDSLSLESCTDKEREGVKAFEDSLKRRSEGEADDNPYWD